MASNKEASNEFSFGPKGVRGRCRHSNPGAGYQTPRSPAQGHNKSPPCNHCGRWKGEYSPPYHRKTWYATRGGGGAPPPPFPTSAAHPRGLSQNATMRWKPLSSLDICGAGTAPSYKAYGGVVLCRMRHHSAAQSYAKAPHHTQSGSDVRERL